MKGISGQDLTVSPKVAEAIAIVRAKDYSEANYQTLLRLQSETNDVAEKAQVARMVEAFIAAAPTLDFMEG